MSRVTLLCVLAQTTTLRSHKGFMGPVGIGPKTSISEIASNYVAIFSSFNWKIFHATLYSIAAENFGNFKKMVETVN